MKSRWCALVAEAKETSRVIHFVGLPPELRGGRDDRVRLPWPQVLVLEHVPGQGMFLYRYAEDGQFCGDTWHANIEDAKHQAECEYGEQRGGWKQIQEGAEDPMALPWHRGHSLFAGWVTY
jgi:hypothetical protein